MAEMDQEKTSFIIDSWTHYYTTMSFDLKDARVNFQRMVNKVRDLIGNVIEA